MTPLPLPLLTPVSLAAAARAPALVPLTTGTPLPLPIWLLPRCDTLAVLDEETDGGAGVDLPGGFLGVGGFSTKLVSVVLQKSARISSSVPLSVVSPCAPAVSLTET